MTKRHDIGIGLSRIDHDEWSWSVERLRDGETTWGCGSDTIADGCEESRSAAIAAIKRTLAQLSVDIKDATILPF